MFTYKISSLNAKFYFKTYFFCIESECLSFKSKFHIKFKIPVSVSNFRFQIQQVF